MNGCLAQIWGLINGMQFIIHLPAINSAFPQNAFLVIGKIIIVATFDIPFVTLESIPEYFPLPDDDDILNKEDQQNIKASLNELGYESAYTSTNLGSMYLIILICGAGLIIQWVASYYTYFPCGFKTSRYLKAQLHWNFVIRLLLEGSLEIAFCAYINL